MRVQAQPPLHLTYCLNIHPGESWAENRAAIQTHALAVKRRVCPGSPFGLGLRLSRAAAEDLRAAERRADLRRFLDENGLYVFTINGFPYGSFHGTTVKENVYAPDWRNDARLEYTCLLADILADLLPDGVDGSISTVPGSYKPWITSAADVHAMADRFADCALYLARLQAAKGREIHLGLEPEPACFLETSGEAISFLDCVLPARGAARIRAASSLSAEEAEVLLRRHIGVCVDVCHAAVEFENPARIIADYRDNGIRVSKIQISAALESAPSADALRPFAEPVYLHQAAGLTRTGAVVRWTDLASAIEDLPRNPSLTRLRVHYHVPLFFAGDGELGSTAAVLDTAFFQLLRRGVCAHLEVETYTYDVLPERLRGGGVDDTVARELGWVIDRLAPDFRACPGPGGISESRP